MTTWNDVREHISGFARTDPSWVSQRSSLLKIIDKAEEHGLDPTHLDQIALSNLSALATEAKRAVRWEDWALLARIFQMGYGLTNQELRLALHISEIEKIQVEATEDLYTLRLTPDQFERIQRTTRARHSYEVCRHSPAPVRIERAHGELIIHIPS